MEEDVYKTIIDESEGFYKDKGSKFICHAIPVKTEEEVKEHLDVLRKKYYDARHHCYAYRLGEYMDKFRANDDGEPSGTAGKPILGQIQSFELTNILIVVIRYFGGTKLGVSGLITAYKAATKDALEQANCKEFTIDDEYLLTFEYPILNQVMRVFKEEDIDRLEQDFQLDCKIKFKVRKKDSNKLYKRFKKIHQVQIKNLLEEENEQNH
ncbi:MAG: YigZ family protein [Bacteroidales bacterium]